MPEVTSAATISGFADASAGTAVAYREHADVVWSCLGRLGLVGADREDALQEVFLVVHRRWASFEGRAAVRTWIYGIAVRVAIAHLRRHRAAEQRSAPVDREPVDHGIDPHAIVEAREAIAVLDALLGELDDDKRTVFVLSDVEGLPVPAVAELLALNPRTAYSRLRVARADFERAVVRWQARRAHVEQPPAALARLRHEARERVPPRVWAGVVLVLERPATIAASLGALGGVGIAKLAIAVGVVVAIGVGAALVTEPPVTVATQALAPSTGERGPEPASVLPSTAVATQPPSRATPRIEHGVRVSTPLRRATTEVDAGAPTPERDARVGPEVARLRRAREALKAGRASDVLVILQGEAPSPALAAERSLLRISALCALGRRDEARGEAVAHANVRPDRDPEALLAERCPSTPRG